MSDRNQEILRKLVEEGSVSKEKLADQFQLTNRQLAYSIDALNNLLVAKDVPPIELRKGRYCSDPAAADYLSVHQGLTDIVFMPDERACVLFVMLLVSDQPVFLVNVSIDLQISKNTALNDIKSLKKALEDDGLQIRFSRKSGYLVTGDEWTIRIKLFQAISQIYKSYGERITAQLLDQWQSYMTLTRKKIKSVERYLSIKYTDEDFYLLIYFISAIFIRIKHHQLLDDQRLADRAEIKQTYEYQALFYPQDEFGDLPVNEKAYITLYFLSANVRNQRKINDSLTLRLSNSLWEFLNEFETKAFIVLPNKKELLVKLINHFVPSYYRIKYHIPVNNVLYSKIKSKYEVLHDFVRQSIDPLEHFFGTTIPDVEISYITLFIGGHLAGNERNDVEEKTIKAVILCPNGVSVSRLLAKSLQKTFPEFMFYPTSSVRDYDGFLLPHDLVFSTVPVESDKKVYVVSDILSKQDQLKLRQKVLQDVFKVNFDGVKPQDVLAVVRRYANVSNEQKLLNALSGLLINTDVTSDDQKETTDKRGLLQILNEDAIDVINSGSWGAILDRAIDLLVRQEIVDKSYRNAIQREYHDQPNYVMLNQNIVLPHLDPDVFSQELGVSLIIVKNGFTYSNRRIHVIALLTTPDKISHLDLLYDINLLAQDNELIEQLAKLNSSDEVLQAISLFFHQPESKDQPCSIS